MGEVYLAEHVHTGWKRALKILPEELSDNIPFVERFKREAAVLDSLKHPHIVRVYEMGVSQGRCYLVMDYIEWSDGKPETLADYQRRSGGRIEVKTFGKLLIQICEALDHAHGMGVVHRDLKPANILLKRKHGAIVSDFGLARVVGDQYLKGRIDESISASMSRGDANESIGADRTEALDVSSRALLGTWDYMSPEVKKGKEATTKSDIYALGVILYRCLTGAPRLSFEPPSELVEGVSPHWDTVYRKMAATLPSKRYDDCRQIIKDLESCLTPGEPVASFPSASQEKTNWEEEQIQRREKESLEMNLRSAVERKDRQEVIRIREVLEEKGWLEGGLLEYINHSITRLEEGVVETKTPSNERFKREIPKLGDFLRMRKHWMAPLMLVGGIYVIFRMFSVTNLPLKILESGRQGVVRSLTRSRSGSNVDSSFRLLKMALESYHVDWNDYPESPDLEALVNEGPKSPAEFSPLNAITSPLQYIRDIPPDPYQARGSFHYFKPTGGPGYFLWSVGPDGISNIRTGEDLDRARDPTSDLHYNVTNGTRSSGDIIKTAPRMGISSRVEARANSSSRVEARANSSSRVEARADSSSRVEARTNSQYKAKTLLRNGMQFKSMAPGGFGTRDGQVEIPEGFYISELPVSGYLFAKVSTSAAVWQGVARASRGEQEQFCRNLSRKSNETYRPATAKELAHAHPRSSDNSGGFYVVLLIE